MPVSTGGTVRSNAEIAAARPPSRFRDKALRSLEGPVFPDSLEHLWHWHLEITMGLGENHDGSTTSLDWVEWNAWKEASRAQPYTEERLALFVLDRIRRHPEMMEKKRER